MTAPPNQIIRLRSDLLDRLDGIEQELMTAHLNRRLWNEFRDEVQTRKPDADATFLRSYAGMYARSQVMVVRRLADDDDRDRPDSLWQIIGRIRRNPRIALRSTRISELREQRPDDPWIVNDIEHDHIQMWGESDAPSDDVLARLQSELIDGSERARYFADKYVAHRDPRREALQVTFGDIEDALDLVTRIANTLKPLLGAPSVAYDAIMTSDWQEVLRPGLFPISPSAYEFIGECFT